MSIVGVISMKGGVGKTSTTANLASALTARLGPDRVSVIDLDPQNALHWHFGLKDAARPGLCQHAGHGNSLREVASQTPFDVTCVPYGAGTEADRKAFETLLAKTPGWLQEQIARNGLDDNAVVLIDTPPGPSVYLEQVFACADLLLIVLLADAASYATIPAMETWLADMHRTRPEVKTAYVLNQVNVLEPLNRDIAALLQQRLGPRVAPLGIQYDEAVCEAMAFQQPVLVYDPHGQASHDLSRLTTWLIHTLNQ
ncbi:cellulose biosynthesis protein BcsQ [Noviherbaspirillum malthae]|uniref:cellulose biosynthesis protein BcsQ n=1 Tax=Noviherbaspirillum malthae TaxID=1260987 RepID=UPI00188E918A|nr:cellulose biosynthesis protein BcsQ [Noviherbaspirillum malthae]